METSAALIVRQDITLSRTQRVVIHIIHARHVLLLGRYGNQQQIPVLVTQVLWQKYCFVLTKQTITTLHQHTVQIPQTL